MVGWAGVRGKLEWGTPSTEINLFNYFIYLVSHEFTTPCLLLEY